MLSQHGLPPAYPAKTNFPFPKIKLAGPVPVDSHKPKKAHILPPDSGLTVLTVLTVLRQWGVWGSGVKQCQALLTVTTRTLCHFLSRVSSRVKPGLTA